MQEKRHKSKSPDLAPEVWVVTDSPLLDRALTQVAERVCGRCIRRLPIHEAAAEAARRPPRIALIPIHLLAALIADSDAAMPPLLAGRALAIEPYPPAPSDAGQSCPAGLGSISLTLSIDEIGRVIRAAWFSNAMRRTRPKGRPASPLDVLTTQEQRLFELIARGSTLQSAATALSINYKTADSRRTRIYRKLNITNGRQAVLVAIRAGLVSA
ncbi:MAG: response regulator transcription factor [Phycisphaerales bacterium]|nr:response regulator transcription factor [Phycisphaerales bacterium]